jgi:hypothetical protein
MGKESYMPKVNPETGNIESTKIIQMGISMDGRTLDGQYFSYVLKTARHLFANPSLLENPLREDEISVL